MTNLDHGQNDHRQHGHATQLELFGPPPAPSYLPDPAKVRAELLDVLAQARTAETMPWQPSRVLYWRTVFPQMTNWLPDDEAARLRQEFAAELARLETAPGSTGPASAPTMASGKP